MTDEPVLIRIGILTISDRCFRRERDDRGGPAIANSLPDGLYEVVRRDVVPDEAASISATLRDWASACDVILTTGGTGLSPRDVTPEATLSVLDRQAPGIPEALRADGLRHTGFAMLSRGVAGTIGRTLVVNLPGSPNGAREGIAVLLPVLEHAVRLLRGEQPHS